QIEMLRQLGVDTAALEKGTLTLDEAFLQAADGLAKMPDGAAKTALAMKALGEQGTKLIPLMNGGRKAIEEQGRQLEKLGGVQSREALAGMEAFNDSMLDV